MTLRKKLVRLAYDKPELRPHLLPILKGAKAPLGTPGGFTTDFKASAKYYSDQAALVQKAQPPLTKLATALQKLAEQMSKLEAFLKGPAKVAAAKVDDMSLKMLEAHAKDTAANADLQKFVTYAPKLIEGKDHAKLKSLLSGVRKQALQVVTLVGTARKTLAKQAKYVRLIQSLQEARRAAQKGEFWYLHLSLIDGSSAKFWKAIGSGLDSPVKIRWGRIGSTGRSLEKDWAYLEKVYPAKIRKGYVPSNPDLDQKNLRRVQNTQGVPPEDLKIITGFAKKVLEKAEAQLKLAIQDFEVQARSLDEFGAKHNVPVEELQALLKIAQQTWRRGISHNISESKRYLLGLNLRVASLQTDADRVSENLFRNQWINGKYSWEHFAGNVSYPAFYELMGSNRSGWSGVILTTDSPSTKLAKKVWDELTNLGYLVDDPYLPLWVVFKKRMQDLGVKV